MPEKKLAGVVKVNFEGNEIKRNFVYLSLGYV